MESRIYKNGILVEKFEKIGRNRFACLVDGTKIPSTKLASIEIFNRWSDYIGSPWRLLAWKLSSLFRIK